jgi:hypothetical protein
VCRTFEMSHVNVPYNILKYYTKLNKFEATGIIKYYVCVCMCVSVCLYSCLSYQHAKLIFFTPHYNCCQFWPAWLHTDFSHYLINYAVFGGKRHIFHVKCTNLIFSSISKYFLNLRKTIELFLYMYIGLHVKF